MYPSAVKKSAMERNVIMPRDPVRISFHLQKEKE